MGAKLRFGTLILCFLPLFRQSAQSHDERFHLVAESIRMRGQLPEHRLEARGVVGVDASEHVLGREVLARLERGDPRLEAAALVHERAHRDNARSLFGRRSSRSTVAPSLILLHRSSPTS